MWLARVSSRLDEARELVQRMRTPRRGGRLRHAGQLRAGGGHRLAGRRRRRPRRRHRGARRAAARSTLARASAGNRRWLAVLRAGLALEAGDLDAAAEHTEAAKPTTPRSRVGVLGLDLHLAARRRRPRPGPSDPPRPGRRRWPKRGTRPRRRSTTSLAAGLTGGMRPEELRPLVDQAGVIPGHRFDEDHPLAPAHRRPAGRGRRRPRRRPRRLRRGRRELARHGVQPAPARPRHRARRRRALPHRPRRRSTTLAPRRRGRRAASLAGAAGASTSCGPCNAGSASATRPSGPPSSRPASGRWPPSSPRASPTPALAERLYISPRTAAVHVSNILAKLGMASRTEVAAWAAREGLTSDS